MLEGEEFSCCFKSGLFEADKALELFPQSVHCGLL